MQAALQHPALTHPDTAGRHLEYLTIVNELGLARQALSTGLPAAIIETANDSTGSLNALLGLSRAGRATGHDTWHSASQALSDQVERASRGGRKDRQQILLRSAVECSAYWIEAGDFAQAWKHALLAKAIAAEAGDHDGLRRALGVLIYTRDMMEPVGFTGRKQLVLQRWLHALWAYRASRSPSHAAVLLNHTDDIVCMAVKSQHHQLAQKLLQRETDLLASIKLRLDPASLKTCEQQLARHEVLLRWSAAETDDQKWPALLELDQLVVQERATEMASNPSARNSFFLQDAKIEAAKNLIGFGQHEAGLQLIEAAIAQMSVDLQSLGSVALDIMAVRTLLTAEMAANYAGNPSLAGGLVEAGLETCAKLSRIVPEKSYALFYGQLVRHADSFGLLQGSQLGRRFAGTVLSVNIDELLLDLDVEPCRQASQAINDWRKQDSGQKCEFEDLHPGFKSSRHEDWFDAALDLIDDFYKDKSVPDHDVDPSFAGIRASLLEKHSIKVLHLTGNIPFFNLNHHREINVCFGLAKRCRPEFVLSILKLIRRLEQMTSVFEIEVHGEQDEDEYVSRGLASREDIIVTSFYFSYFSRSDSFLSCIRIDRPDYIDRYIMYMLNKAMPA